MACILAGRDFLFDDEFEIVKWKYSQFLEINFKVNWMTPYDPRTEFRYPDYSKFKKAVYLALEESKESAMKVIENGKYKSPRVYKSIEEMIENCKIKIDNS